MLQLSGVLGCSWVVVSGVISRVTIIITRVKGLITPLMTTHEPQVHYTPTSFRRAQPQEGELLRLGLGDEVGFGFCVFRGLGYGEFGFRF